MTPAFRRGSVAACGKVVGVVWMVRSAELVLLPIGRSQRPRCRAEVPISALSDMQAAGVVGRELVIQCDQPAAAPIDGQRLVGELPGRIACQVSHAVARAASDAALFDRWATHGRHRAHVRRSTGVRA